MAAKGVYTKPAEIWKHLRPYGKRQFWKRERKAARLDAKERSLAFVVESSRCSPVYYIR